MPQRSTRGDSVAPSSPGLRSAKRSRIMPPSFMDPPSSPPPMTPLPLPPMSPSPMSSIHSPTPPPRPPRSPVSLPDLGPPRFHSAEQLRSSFELTLASPDTLSHVQGPFRSPVKSSIQLGTHAQALRHTTSQMASHSLDDLDKVLLEHPGNGRTWWSQTVTTPPLLEGVPVGSPDFRSIPCIPAKSKKRKSQRPPQKVVARSALHIPSVLYSDESHSGRVTTSPSTSHVIVALLHDEPITSLPPWPGTAGTDNDAEEYSCRTMTKTSHLDRNTARHENFSPARTRLVDAVAERQVLFRAVTNLEEPIPTSETVSTATRGTELDNALQPVRQVWSQRHRKQIWIVATVAVVLLTAAGIVVSIIWKLTRAR